MYSVISKTSFALMQYAASCRITSNVLSQWGGANYLSYLTRPTVWSHLIKSQSCDYQQVAHTSSFFNKKNANSLWKSVSSVSAAGSKRGRGKTKGKKVIRNLNRGQIIGIGPENIRWPGLSAPIIRGREIIQREKLPIDADYREKLLKMRERVFKPKKAKVAPIDRGWTGGQPGGRKLGAPDPLGEETFEGFDTVILDQKSVVKQSKLFGRRRVISALCCTGNKNGLVGFSLAQAPDFKTALRKAKNRAAQRLMYVPRYEERTVIHNFYSSFCRTKVYVWKQSPGYGLHGHRVVKSICEMIGIKDLRISVEGGKSVFNITQAFLLGMLRQKSFDELSQETKLHVVEMSRENDYFPKIVSSPENPIETLEETPDFELYLFDKKVFNERSMDPSKLKRPRTWPITLRRQENLRSQLSSSIKILAEYGECKSFLTETWPECKHKLPPWTLSVRKAEKQLESEANNAEINL